MYRAFALFALIALTGAIETPTQLAAQTGTNVAPVPGPYQSIMPQRVRPNPYANQNRAQRVPYWMRPQSGGAGQGGGAGTNQSRPQNFIPGWVWSPYAPNTQAPAQIQPRQPQAGYWPGPQMQGYGPPPWGQPGYAPGMWPNTPYGAPQGYGAPMQPNQ